VKPPQKPQKARKSDATRARILSSALRLFRARGFEATTMRDVAEEAGVAPGAAYYYFRSKEALLLAYYADNQASHEGRVADRLSAIGDLRARLGLVFHEKLEAVRRERRLLGAIVPRLADPTDPVSAFAAETHDIRERSIALFDRALEGEGLDPAARRLVAPALWMLHMGLMLYFVHDRSAGQHKTHRLVDDLLDLIVPLVRLGQDPMFAGVVLGLGEALARAGLIATAS
jgi:AcrR family transcriptional regulator